MKFQLSHLTLIALGFVLSHHASSFSVAPSQGTFRRVSSALAVAFSSFDASSSDIPDGEISLARHSEYQNLEPLYESDVRRARMERDLINRQQFVKYGNDLWNLRETMTKLSIKLMDAVKKHKNKEGKELQSQIRAKLRMAESQDPELIYKIELEAMHNAQREGRTQDAELHSKRAFAARSCLPQFNLEGLWVGK
jgi:serine/threonine protein kinase HipA of HipAB toxin-antitoxin module